jgi:hypothetical protein
MIKRLILSLALAFGLIAPSHGAGTIPFSLSQQFDSLGHVLAGCQLYTIQAGTTSTPQSAYQDSALTIALPNPQTCDAAGRLPQMFLADGTIKVRLTDRNGVSQIVADNIQVIGASSGGGGGGTVDPTTILATGDLKVSYGTGVLSGFVRANGRTIGSATSGATERANSDTNALFVYLWSADANLAVSGGRGASAAADWAANKTIALPDWRGKTLAGLADMGNSATSILTATYAGCTTTPTTLGAFCGSQSQTLLTSNLPPYTPSGSIAANFPNTVGGSAPNIFLNGGCCIGLGGASSGATPQSIAGVNIPSTFSGAAQGGTSTPFSTVSPTMLATIYLKI